MTNKLIMEIKWNQTQLMKRKARKKENEQKNYRQQIEICKVLHLN